MKTVEQYRYYAQLRPSTTHVLCTLEIDWGDFNADRIRLWPILEYYRLNSVKTGETFTHVHIPSLLEELEKDHELP